MTDEPKKPLIKRTRKRSPKQEESAEKLLESGKATRFTSGGQAAENGRKGGKKSQEVQRERREFEDFLRIALSKTSDSSKPMTDLEDLPSLSKEDIMNSNLPVEQKWVLAIVKDLVHGDVRTTELVLKVLGQMPTNKVELSGEVTVKDDLLTEEDIDTMSFDEITTVVMDQCQRKQ